MVMLNDDSGTDVVNVRDPKIVYKVGATNLT